MICSPLTPLGAEVTDLPVGALAPDDAEALRALLAEHGVLVLPDQRISDDDFLAFLRSFGELVFTVGETPLPGYPDLNVISNVGRISPPRSQFHVDTSYVARPPAYTALRAVQVPSAGGETLFSDQYAAYDTLPPETVSHLAGRTVTHVVTGVDPSAAGPETSAEHPLFRPHPLSGRTALYLSTPQRCAAISGLPAEEAATTVAALIDHSTRSQHVLRHAWAPGDVVMWDNGCVMHQADHSGVTGDRVMHRGMVAGY